MLRAHRCRRYAARLKELIRCTPVDPLLLTEGEVTDLACLHADSTRPTAGECLLHDDRSPVLLLSSLHPAPETLWDEDLALLTLLLKHFGLRPSVETGLALYTAVLCRSAGFTDCPEFEGFERPALAEGADLGTLLVDFLYPESKNPGVWETPGFGVQDVAEFAAG